MAIQFKKGLFLAEILLAVVIAAVIMGSGYLLYADIEKENKKNIFAENLSALTVKLNQFYGEAPAKVSGRTATNDNLILVRSKTIPSTMNYTMNAAGTSATITSAFGGDVYIGPVEDDTSLYYIKSYLDKDQCSAVLQHLLKTKPIALGKSSGTFVKSINLIKCITDSDTKRSLVTQICAYTYGKTTTNLLIPIYSPKGESWKGCPGRI